MNRSSSPSVPTLSLTQLLAILRHSGFVYEARTGEWLSPLRVLWPDLGQSFKTPQLAYLYLWEIGERYRAGRYTSLRQSLQDSHVRVS